MQQCGRARQKRLPHQVRGLGKEREEGSGEGSVCCFLSLSSGPALVVRPSGSLGHCQAHSPRLKDPLLDPDSLRGRGKLPFRPATGLSLPMSSADLEGLDREKPHG